MSDQDNTPRRRLIKSTIFLLILGIHGVCLLILTLQGTVRIPRQDAQEALVFLAPPAAAAPPFRRSILHPGAVPFHTESVPPLRHPAAPALPERPAAQNSPRSIDWTAEAERTAEEQAQLAADPRPRPLDGHASAGAGLAKKPEFGWYHARIHRVEKLKDGGMILWINDRCFIPAVGLAFIPFPFCGIGKIPARGDLFDHMHDPHEPGGSAETGAP